MSLDDARRLEHAKAVKLEVARYSDSGFDWTDIRAGEYVQGLPNGRRRICRYYCRGLGSLPTLQYRRFRRCGPSEQHLTDQSRWIHARNSVLLISHYEELVTGENKSWRTETVLRGPGERLLPILMTALVVALGLLPIALDSEEAGKEIEGPMVIVILGDLVTSTIRNPRPPCTGDTLRAPATDGAQSHASVKANTR